MEAEKIKQQLNDIRKTAVDLDNALRDKERAKRFAKIRAKHQRKKDKIKEDPNSAYEKIIAKGTALEKALLELEDFYRSRKLLTEDQQKRLRASIRTKRQEFVLQEIGTLSDGFMNYYKFYLLMTQKLWEADANYLGLLCQQWDMADHQAKTLTDIFYSKSYHAESDEDTQEALLKLATEYWYTPDTMPKVVKSDEDDRYRIIADVDGDGGLYSKIKQSKAVATSSLRLLRGAVEVLSDFAFTELSLISGGCILPYMTVIPPMVMNALDEPDKISYNKVAGSKKYFAYNLRKRKEQGEQITPEDEKRAVIPDYNQVHEEEPQTRVAKRELAKYLSQHYDQNKDYGI